MTTTTEMSVSHKAIACRWQDDDTYLYVMWGQDVPTGPDWERRWLDGQDWISGSGFGAVSTGKLYLVRKAQFKLTDIPALHTEDNGAVIVAYTKDIKPHAQRLEWWTSWSTWQTLGDPSWPDMWPVRVRVKAV